MLYIWGAVICEGGTCERDYFTKVDFFGNEKSLSRLLGVVDPLIFSCYERVGRCIAPHFSTWHSLAAWFFGSGFFY